MSETATDVMVVDDSALVRQIMTSFLGDCGLTVRTAADPLIALLKIEKRRPDVIVLDLEMPRMDGLTFLQKLMVENPIPVVVCSSIAERGSEAAMRAFQLGAVDVVAKPQRAADGSLTLWKNTLLDAVTAAASANVSRFRVAPPKRLRRIGRMSPGETIVVIGASTGGTEAISHVLHQFPEDAPATVIVQHMPERFTAAFARRLDQTCAVDVREAADGDVLQQGRVLIAPGNRHLMLVRGRPGQIGVLLNDAPPVNRHRPSADVLFNSAAHIAGSSAVGVLLTGMGSDGARGLLALREAGAITIAQDESTSVVFGMPRAAIEIGGAVHVRRLGDIAATILGSRARTLQL